RSHDGAYANAAGLQFGSTLATAAAVIVLLHLGAPVPPQIAPWLLTQHHPAGGFLAMPQAPAPDLLSTAVALHALGSLGTPFDQIRQPCLNFINSLRSNDGGFHAHCADQYPDVEYTYYALLALGHLAGNETGDANFQVRNNCE
ncbi:MAG: terpene cyclase/mutase family protein, partial [Verrucomicrobiae bacterium]|nr:terpene cyclase/mutase family protein [Verrucomicrobiae bacterium]